MAINRLNVYHSAIAMGDLLGEVFWEIFFQGVFSLNPNKHLFWYYMKNEKLSCEAFSTQNEVFIRKAMCRLCRDPVVDKRDFD